MTTLGDLEQAIDALLNHPLGVNHYHLVRHVEEKAYEAYIFGLCLRAVRELGVTPVLQGISAPPVPFIFRGGPGQIHSQTRNYGYAEFSLNASDFEIHAGIEFVGTSGMTHELDVCILRADEAAKCRRLPDDPRAAALIAGWECKFYAGTLHKGLGRAFVGLLDDIGKNARITAMCSNSSHPQLRQYFRLDRRPHAHFDLTPLRPDREGEFVNHLKVEIRKMAAA